MVISEFSAPTSTVIKNWSALTTHLKHYFFSPDLQALQIALAAATSHFVVKGDPAWLLVIGPSSSGKTSIIINALSALPSSHIQGDITPRTFISHYKKRGAGGAEPEDQGLLHKIKNGILLFKDFTTILSKRDDDKKEIFAQLREIYDGEWVRTTGMGGNAAWKGKITVVAACTPHIEEAWKLYRDLGERFVAVRWARNGGLEMGRYATLQRGKEHLIKQLTMEHTAKFVDRTLNAPEHFPDELAEKLYALAELTAVLRTNVHREAYGDRVITGTSEPEESPRLTKTLELIAGMNASLFERKISVDDYAIAQRVAMDSISLARRRIFQSLAAVTQPIPQSEVARLANVPKTSVHWHGEELSVLGVVALQKSPVGEWEMGLTPMFRELWGQSFNR